MAQTSNGSLILNAYVDLIEFRGGGGPCHGKNREQYASPHVRPGLRVSGCKDGETKKQTAGILPEAENLAKPAE